MGIKESLSAIVDQVKTTVTAIKIPEGVSKTDIADAVDTGFADFDSKVASAIAKYSNKDDWKTIVDDGIAS